MKRLSIKLDPQVAQWLNEKAGAEGRPVSEIIAEKLRGSMYVEKSTQGFPPLNIKPFDFEWVGGRRPTREDLYDRPCLRRY